MNYAMLFACRALFGIGMGGVWAAGLPLALEHWPKNLRGIASGMLMGGFNWGYILAALVFQVLYPVISQRNHFGWRALFWVAALPILLVPWIRSRVLESPVWLAWRDNVKRHDKPAQTVYRKNFSAGSYWNNSSNDSNHERFHVLVLLDFVLVSHFFAGIKFGSASFSRGA